MARVVKLQDAFSRGMIRDIPRDKLPANAAYQLTDFIPDMEAGLRKRHGYTYASNDISAVTATAQYVIGGIYAPFVAAPKNLAIDEDGRLYNIATDGTVTDIGAAVTVSQNPVFHRNKVIIPAAGGATAPKVYDGTTLGNLGGSPPNGTYATVHKDRTVLARTTANTERLWFSDPGDPAAWDTTNTYWDSSFPVTGLFAIRNAILIFSLGHVERLRGSIPPPDSDMTLDPLFEVGCTDARSISPWGDNVLFANPGGIYITDGSALDDLTLQAGIKKYWQVNVTDSTYTISGATYQNYYFVSVMNAANPVKQFLFDIPRRVVVELSNVRSVSAWRAVKEAEEVYFGPRRTGPTEPRVAKLSSIFTFASSAQKDDGNGTAVLPVYESPYFMDRPNDKTWKALYLAYDLTAAAAEDPVIVASYKKTIEGSYVAISPSFTETSDFDRQRRRLNFPSPGIAIRLAQTTNGSVNTRIYGIEADVHSREQSRVA